MVMLYESERLRLNLSDGIATLWLGDVATRNCIGLPFLEELDAAISAADRSPAIEVLVVRSGVAGVFAGGPDLGEIARLDDAEARLEHAAIGQHVLQRLEKLSPGVQTVAVIEGRCHGAGLELALACSRRLAVARSDVTFAFDGVHRGVPPCWGGTVRIAKVVGLKSALDSLSGRPIAARAAHRIGLVDRIVGARQARTELLWYLAELQDLSSLKPSRGRSWWRRLRELPLFAGSMARHSERSLPDPVCRAMIESVLHGWREGAAEGMSKERRSFASMVDSAESMRRQARARRIERHLRSCSDIPTPGRTIVIGGAENGIELAVLALQTGLQACVVESIPVAREKAEAHLRHAVFAAASAGWFNALEVDAKMSGVVVPAAAVSFHENDLVLVAGKSAQGPAALLTLESSMPKDSLLVSLAPMQNLTASFAYPQRCAAMQVVDPIGAGATVELRPLPATTGKTIARLARWIDHCGLNLHDAPAQTPAAVPAVFAA